jgi:rhodanese-related sulfurtransferase
MPHDSGRNGPVNGELGLPFGGSHPLSRPMPFPLEVNASEAARLFQTGAILVDVREPNELAVCQVAGSKHIPIREIPARTAEIPRDQQVLVLCHHGGRSARVTQFLRANGWENVTNVGGGIDAWAMQVDPTLARY